MTDRIISVRGRSLVDVPKPFTYVGRGAGGWHASPLGNPNRVTRESGRRAAVAGYAIHLVDHSELIDLIVRLALADAGSQDPHRTFGCWCAPKLCHAEVVADIYDHARSGMVLTDVLADRCRLLSTWIEFGGRYPFQEPPDPVGAVREPTPLPLVGV